MPNQDYASKASYSSGHAEPAVRALKWRSVANTAPHIIPYLKPNMRILDVGCGPGTITADFAQYVPDGEVVGADADEEMINQAKGQQGIAPNVSFRVGNIHKLPFEDDSFDVVHTHAVLLHAQEPVHAMTEMRRVLKPGGILASKEVDNAMTACYPSTPTFERWKDLFSSTIARSGGDPRAGRQLHVWARQAGFARESITNTAVTWPLTTRDETRAWGTMFADRISSSPLKQNMLAAGASEDELAEMQRWFREWSEDENAWLCFVSGQVVAVK